MPTLRELLDSHPSDSVIYHSIHTNYLKPYLDVSLEVPDGDLPFGYGWIKVRDGLIEVRYIREFGTLEISRCQARLPLPLRNQKI
ncbi:hypothetical protein A3K63_04815 [Candidatus Micrarchaeota archaeon RBG_16_49_10]|nr:MAG: hypothetical protein A3K63_04815 [Candidatus Micrarchaeota archaeon RBG_16_49_10]